VAHQWNAQPSHQKLNRTVYLQNSHASQYQNYTWERRLKHHRRNKSLREKRRKESGNAKQRRLTNKLNSQIENEIKAATFRLRSRAVHYFIGESGKTRGRAAESLAGARGKFFLGAPIAKFFQEKLFSDEYVVIDFKRLYLNCSYQISVLCPKKQISCPLHGNISPKKMTGAQQKFLGAPRGNLPPPPCPPPPSRRR
jgi:hypothetical protein